jgi:hypothetical protein
LTCIVISPWRQLNPSVSHTRCSVATVHLTCQMIGMQTPWTCNVKQI